MIILSKKKKNWDRKYLIVFPLQFSVLKFLMFFHLNYVYYCNHLEANIHYSGIFWSFYPEKAINIVKRYYNNNKFTYVFIIIYTVIQISF